ncbi:hypothetical protein K435DRAFT_672145 [Dendrothele bispora CBS 962.96]|uniref:Uncharacterized protein n=1 Tax=Dendrothele bispora (strain CBS 962.96) TaxID=1314807 RepID=A0A4S8LTM6_DENBC|nr:hypothetical protein K435DRAFT_672145 [Dendrothele bispora CBS 962.96]
MFDTTKFSVEDPLSFEDVPWPVLVSPRKLSLDSISWESVEAFFIYANSSLDSNQYKDLIVASHQHFHPDRWGARGLLKTVVNEGDRDNLSKGKDDVLFSSSMSI